MKAVALITYTDCFNKWKSLESVGHDVTVIQYDDRPHERHGELVDAVRVINPDFTLLIGAIEQYHGRPVPYPDVLRAIKSIAPFVHMCDDAGDPPWWPMLEVYEAEKCFTVQVSIDGAPGTPIDRFENGMLALTPIDWRSFKPVPWDKKTINLGMVGGLGHASRREITESLLYKGILDFRVGPIGRSYDEMAEIMCSTKVTYNIGITGSTQSMHVKGRVVEAGFAGSDLLEKAGSPLERWFSRDEYMMFDTADEAVYLMENTSDAELQHMAHRLRSRILREHHPAVFWHNVLGKAFGHA